MRLLLVEDDQKLSAVLYDGFREHHFRVAVASTFSDGLRQLTAAAYDLIILDVLLPSGSGFDLCARARAAGLTTPILMLTARDAVEDRVRGLETGADDYLTKPFAFPELLARVRALARRQPSLRPVIHKIADLEVNLDAHEVSRGGQRDGRCDNRAHGTCPYAVSCACAAVWGATRGGDSPAGTK